MSAILLVGGLLLLQIGTAGGVQVSAAYEDALAAARGILEASGWRFQRLVVPASTRHPIWANVPLLKKASSRKDLWPGAAELTRVDDVFGDYVLPLVDVCRRLGITPSTVPMYLVCGALRADVFHWYINGDMALQPAFGDLGHLQLADELAA